MEEREGFVEFFEDASRMYDFLNGTDEVLELWEQLAHIADHNETDYETVFDLLTEEGNLKIIYGPPYTVVFEIAPGNRILVYTIRQPNF